MQIFFATKNRSKWDYFKKWCERISDLETITPYDIDEHLWPEIEENGKTLEDNAILKALGWSNIVPNVIVLANDCGVDVPGLGKNWKQEWTKRSTGDEKTSDIDRIKAFIEITKSLVGENRVIQWTDSIALAKNGKILGSTSALYPVGYIINSLPENPVIIPGAPLATIEYKPQFNKVYSELTEDEIHEHNKEVEVIFQNFVIDTLL